MKSLIGIINLLSVLLIVLGLINPKIISEIFRKTFTRKKVILIFGATWLISLIFWNVMSPKTTSHKGDNDKQAITSTITPTKNDTQIDPKNETKENQNKEINQMDEDIDLINKINKLAVKNYSGFEVSIWDKNSNFGSKATPPYEIVLNAPISASFYDCNEVKRAAYYTIEALYMDTDIRNKISRVLVSFPNYLRVSLGSKDGIPMANDNIFIGPTNFWQVMEKSNLMTEKETGDWNSRTWGKYLKNCQ